MLKYLINNPGISENEWLKKHKKCIIKLTVAELLKRNRVNSLKYILKAYFCAHKFLYILLHDFI